MAKTRPTGKRGKRKPSAFDAEQQQHAKDLRRSLALEKRVTALVKALARAMEKSGSALDELTDSLVKHRAARRLFVGGSDSAERPTDARELAPQ